MSRIPDIVIERVHLGEGTSEQRARVMADPDAKARLAELDAADAAFLKHHPTREMVGDIQRKLHLARTQDAARTRRERWTLAGLVLVPLAAVTVAMVLVDPPSRPAELADPLVDVGSERAKGDAQLLVYRSVNGKVRTINEGVVLRERDLLRLGYQPGAATHGALLSIDGRGEVTLHAPDDGNTALETGRRYLVPHGYQLDDAPDFERFFLVTADTRFDVTSVVDAAEELARSANAKDEPLPLPDGLSQNDFLILKDVP